jgi:hypothetical protein
MRNPIFDTVGRALWAIALLGSAFAGVNYWLTYSAQQEISAPQLAALAAESLVYAIVPYVLARAWDEVSRPRPVVSTVETRAELIAR